MNSRQAIEARARLSVSVDAGIEPNSTNDELVFDYLLARGRNTETIITTILWTKGRKLAPPVSRQQVFFSYQ